MRQPDQVHHLESLLRRCTLKLRVARRCRALLLATEGLNHTDIGTKVDMPRNAISKIRTHFKVKTPKASHINEIKGG